MADGSLRTPGTGETVRTIDKAGTGQKVQVVVLDVGGSGTEALFTPPAVDAAQAGNPFPVSYRASKAVPTAMSADGDAQLGWVSLAGANVVSEYPGRQRLTATPTVTAATTNYTAATATASGDAVGGLLTFNLGTTVRDNGAFRIVGALLTDRGAKAYWLRLHLFGVNPTSPPADNAAMDLTDANAEAAHWLGDIDFRPGDANVHTSNAWCLGTYGGMPLTRTNALEGICDDATAKTSFYGQLEVIAAGAVALTFYTGTTDLVLALLVDPYS